MGMFGKLSSIASLHHSQSKFFYLIFPQFPRDFLPEYGQYESFFSQFLPFLVDFSHGFAI
jgi:hypothetical protein